MTGQSMTGFASLAGEAAGFAWVLEARSVNARGLDLRLRLPEGAEPLEPKLREAAKAAFARGGIQVSLRLRPAAEGGAAALNRELMQAALQALHALEAAAMEQGISLAPTTAGALLAQRGMLDAGASDTGPEAALPGIEARIPELFAALAAERTREGAALAAVMAGQLDRVAQLTEAAAVTAEARAARAGEVLKSRVAALLEAQNLVDPDRLAQELALLAVKSDVTEEIDRLRAHVAAARALLQAPEPAGRKLDFLMQEFNREANTLCSKAQDSALTNLGLELKVVIDQMREQCQNLE